MKQALVFSNRVGIEQDDEQRISLYEVLQILYDSDVTLNTPIDTPFKNHYFILAIWPDDSGSVLYGNEDNMSILTILEDLDNFIVQFAPWIFAYCEDELSHSQMRSLFIGEGDAPPLKGKYFLKAFDALVEANNVE